MLVFCWALVLLCLSVTLGLYICGFDALMVRSPSCGPNNMYIYEPQQNVGQVLCTRKIGLRPPSYLSRLMTKSTKWHVRPAKTQISLGIFPVWSESSLSAWRKHRPLATHWAHSEDSDQIGRMLIWVFRIVYILLRCTHSHFVGFVSMRLIYYRPLYGGASVSCLSAFWFSFYLHIHVCEQRRLWRDCADAQARLSLRWSPMW